MADVYEEQLPQIRDGSRKVDITAEALPGRTLHGHVDFIEPREPADNALCPCMCMSPIQE